MSDDTPIPMGHPRMSFARIHREVFDEMLRHGPDVFNYYVVSRPELPWNAAIWFDHEKHTINIGTNADMTLAYRAGD